MNLANSHLTNQTKSSTGLINRFSQRIISSLPTRRPLKSDYEKSRTYESEFAENNTGHCTSVVEVTVEDLQGTKKSRSPLVTSNSFHKTLNGKGETKKAPSMIPRSKSRKRTEGETEGENFKFVNEQKANGLNEEVKSQKELFRDSLHVGFNSGNESEKKEIMVKLIIPTTQKPLEEGNEIESTSLSLKSCEDFEFNEVKSKVSESSYKDAQEEVHQEAKRTINIPQENDTSKNPTTGKELKEEELETRRQERIIRNLYESIIHATGPLLDDPKWSWSGAKKENPIKGESKNDCGNFVNVQHYYDHTMEEISEIWKDAVSLINSVRDHTIKFVEGKSKTIDKEQLILEAEMLQLAIDFAINYSKVKTEFLVKSLRKHFEVGESEKSNLEKFMESKSVAALYNDDDLASMAQTVKELNTSVLKGEDLELE